ncbi:fumarylacetoacetate hydrolase family protein [Pararhodobacter zhoushanensis]|uniref:Fumarylacetoacetate hydrolase family protein n=1 Tax=Pararhodobacter zhoushanensis TaxID=2479545 RepID=A0ABT3GU50_9RHOB|nr:fumarylacetoacetate hydrolase family protein [Pararhodobacter zhoushanensis]MCW1931056.1 fumarylacetoacetate hydrolase family protein [Pararhodobacter zhoushanensis]
MRLTSHVLPDGTPSYGRVDGDRIIDAGAALRAKYPDLKAVLAADAIAALEKADGPAIAVRDATFLPTVPNPEKIICIGLNYMGHIKETGRDKPTHPSIFTRYPRSLVGHGQPMVRPKVSDKFDFEGEIAIVIGKGGRAIPAVSALDHVAGYTIFNDGSIRDFQRHTTQFWGGKNFDRTGSMGPWMVTADELGDPTAPQMETRLNGAVMQSTSVGDLAFSIADLIAYLSTITELAPGDIIPTGTPSGVGLFRDPPLFMKAGDQIEVEISGIGVLSNPIIDEA